MNPDITLLLEELDKQPTTSMSVHTETGPLDLVQCACWYYEVRRGNQVLARGTRAEPLTDVEVEDLLQRVGCR